MALFTKFKKAKEAAVEHKKNTAAQQAKQPTTPYKHIPTHAAQDALAAQPTILKPDELRARVAKAKERRASTYQPPVIIRHSVYHSCESSRASSRTNSTACFSPGSAASSVKGKSIDTSMRRSQTPSWRHSLPVMEGQVQAPEFLGGSPVFTPPTQRPRPLHSKSTRSSFTQKKSPLSVVSVDEEPPEFSSSSSDHSAESPKMDEPQRSKSNDEGVAEDAATIRPSGLEQQKPSITALPVKDTFVKQRSKWSILPRSSIDIAAH